MVDRDGVGRVPGPGDEQLLTGGGCPAVAHDVARDLPGGIGTQPEIGAAGASAAGQHMAVHQDAAARVGIVQRVDTELAGEDVQVIASAAFKMIVTGQSGEGVVAGFAIEVVAEGVVGAFHLIGAVIAEGDALTRPSCHCIAERVVGRVPCQHLCRDTRLGVGEEEFDHTVRRIPGVRDDRRRFDQCIASVDDLKQKGTVIEPLVGDMPPAGAGHLPAGQPCGMVFTTGVLPQGVQHRLRIDIGRIPDGQCQRCKVLQGHQSAELVNRQGSELGVCRQDANSAGQRKIVRVGRRGHSAGDALNRRVERVPLRVAGGQQDTINAKERLDRIDQVLETTVLAVGCTSQQVSETLQRQESVQPLQHLEHCERIGHLSLVVVP